MKDIHIVWDRALLRRYAVRVHVNYSAIPTVSSEDARPTRFNFNIGTNYTLGFPGGVGGSLGWLSGSESELTPDNLATGTRGMTTQTLWASASKSIEVGPIIVTKSGIGSGTTSLRTVGYYSQNSFFVGVGGSLKLW